MTDVDDALLRDRFARLQGESDGDWKDVRRRARGGARRVTVIVTVFVVALVATGFGLGGRVIGFFSDNGKPIPLSSLSPHDRELLVTNLCRRLAFSRHAGNVQTVCKDGKPTIKQIANDGHEIHWLVRYPWGVTCIASGPVGGFHNATGRSMIGLIGCNVGAPGERLVPTPRRPITTDLSIGASRADHRVRLLRASGLAGEGVAAVGLVARNGVTVKVPVRGRSYSFGAIPKKDWVAIAAFDDSGKELYRKQLELPRITAVVPRVPPHSLIHAQAPNPPRIPRGTPLQHGVSSNATAEVYRLGVVVFRFTSLDSTAYRILAKSNIASPACGKVAFGGHWENIAGGGNARMGPEVRIRMEARFGGFPRPPFDYCEITGFYGRYWDDEQGTRELVEVAFTRAGRRYLDERATARDLGYFVRTRKLERIRKAVHRGERGPTAEEIARLFGSRVVALPGRRSAPPSGKLGVWTDGRSIVARERAFDGRLLFVTVNGVSIGYNNLRNLAHVF
jgi:hypothetical protein